jgi:hypothetical protein
MSGSGCDTCQALVNPGDRKYRRVEIWEKMELKKKIKSQVQRLNAQPSVEMVDKGTRRLCSHCPLVLQSAQPGDRHVRVWHICTSMVFLIPRLGWIAYACIAPTDKSSVFDRASI